MPLLTSRTMGDSPKHGLANGGSGDQPLNNLHAKLV